MEAKQILDAIVKNKLDFVTGVPCSIFKSLLKQLNLDERLKHIYTSSEGEAIGLATGYYLGTKKPALVYMQNSGLGNCVDPLTSLANKEVYGIPMVLFISWRGELGINDAVQHKKMGKIQNKLLDILKIPYKVARDNKFDLQLVDSIALTKKLKQPVAIIFKKGGIV